jgi:hypothetical protein
MARKAFATSFEKKKAENSVGRGGLILKDNRQSRSAKQAYMYSTARVKR